MALWTDLEGLNVAGRYELQAHLATGGMAAIYRGWDHRLGRPVAVKLLRDDVDAENEGDGDTRRAELERFRREARAVAALRSPYIVEVFDFIMDDGRTYLVMELVDGPNLKQRIQHGGPLAVDEALTYAIHVCRALTQAHARGYIHRDIKPQNILLTSSGITKLTDFGIVHVGGASLTASGLVLGTADYIAPEQAQGLTLAPASDLYSLGIVLFEMLTAEVPFFGASPTAVALRHTSEPLPPLRLRNPRVSPLVERIVLRAAAKDPTRRFTSAGQMEAVLTHALAVHGGLAPQQSDEAACSCHTRVVAGGVGALRAATRDPVTSTLPLPDGADDLEESNELDWHDVALLLSLTPTSWQAAGAPHDEPLDAQTAPVLFPQDVEVPHSENAASAGPMPLASLWHTLPHDRVARLVWTASTALLLLIAILVLRMLL